MSDKDQSSKDYSKIIVIDSNVVLEGKLLTDQPWSEISEKRPILLLVVPQVAKEIDKRKHDGRLQIHARKFNRLMEPAILLGGAVTIVQGEPRVDIQYASVSKIPWDEFDDLDKQEADDKIIAQVLHIKNFDKSELTFLSHDINPIALASRYGIEIKKLPEKWLREPAQNPHEKEVINLQKKVAVLESTEPDFEFGINFLNTTLFQINKVQQLSTNEQANVVQKILKNNPRIDQDIGNRFLSRINYNTRYYEEYENYKNIIVPNYAPKAHLYIEKQYNQFKFIFKILNKGDVQAENLVVRLSSPHAQLQEKWFFVSSKPIAPRPKPQLAMSINHHALNSAEFHRRAVGKHEMDIYIESDHIEILCEDFRHNREWSFEGIARVNTNAITELVLNVEITTSNMKSKKEKAFKLPCEILDGNVSDFIDYDVDTYLKEAPGQEELDKAFETEEFDNFKFVKFDGEE